MDMKLTVKLGILMWGMYSINVQGQTLFVPNATTNGIANSTNSDVGIGTSSPAHTLSLYRNENANLGIVTQQGTSEATLWFRINSLVRDAAITYRSNGRLSFSLDDSDGGMVQNNEYMTILNTGNIGMGVVTPYAASRLHLKSVNASVWGFMTEASSNKRLIGVGHDGNAGYVSVSYLEDAGYTPLYFNTSNLTRMAIAVNGNVGIGTATPAARLHVAGSAYFGNENTDSHYRVSVGGSGGDYGSVGYGYKYSLTSNVHSYAVSDLASQIRFHAGGFNFLTAPTGTAGSPVTFSTVMVVKQNGNVGIGTITPDAKLAVKGAIHAEEVKVDLNVPAPDYVFEKNYNLLTLEEVEKYIDQNKHLPEDPAAKEMEANGVNLGEMNMLLLKKVEELTLYLIELKKENEVQTEENNRLEAEIQFIKKSLETH